MDQASRDTRFPEVDLLKASGILAVVLIHSLRPWWDPAISSEEVVLGRITRFAVPAFLGSSGFLYAARGYVPARTTLRRLARLGFPYLVASFAAQMWRVVREGREWELESVVRDLLFGSSFGPYYYIFVLFWLILLTPLLARGSRTTLLVLTMVFILTQAYLESGVSDMAGLYWNARSPLLWWGYFLIAWIVRLHHDRVKTWIARRRPMVVAGGLACSAVCIAFAGSDALAVKAKLATWLAIHGTLVFLFALACGRQRFPALLRMLSDSTYAIYLFHLFFVYTAQAQFRAEPGSFDLAAIAIPWCCGLVGPLAIVILARPILGSRARYVVGA